MNNSWDRQEWRDARETLANLLTTDTRIPEVQLFEASRLTPRLFERALLELLGDGVVRRYPHGNDRPSYTLSRDETEAGADAGDLSRDARAVHAYLQRAPNTARQIAITLDLMPAEVNRILDDLERLHLVTFRYVGQLNIYRVCG